MQGFMAAVGMGDQYGNIHRFQHWKIIGAVADPNGNRPGSVLFPEYFRDEKNGPPFVLSLPDEVMKPAAPDDLQSFPAGQG